MWVFLTLDINIIMHQHGPQCRHGHGHGHGHGGMPGMAMGFGGQQQEESPDEYLKSLKKKWDDKDMRVFFWQQFLHGVVIDRLYEKWGLDFMRSLTCQAPQMIVHSIQMMINFDWIPFRLKPIFCGMFFPICILLFFNYNVVVGMADTDDLLKTMVYITMFLYVMVALRGSSVLKGERMEKKSKEIFEVRPYLQNPNMSCQACRIVRLFRATHCPFCKTCIAKHSRHSVVFGSCIGAANEMLCLLFFFFLGITLNLIIIRFWNSNTYGVLTKLMFYLLNIPLSWMSYNQALQFFVFNYMYGITEQELKIWGMLQYLQRIPEKGFSNNVHQGFWENVVGSFMALFGIKGYESEQGWGTSQLEFPRVDPSRVYTVNWDQAVIYLIPQMPFHKKRHQILQMMQRDEPRMIEMFKLQKKFKAEVLAEPGADQLNEFQIQQKLAMKMQAHMMKNNPQMMQQPSMQQQKAIQLQMLVHMKKQFASDEDLLAKVIELESKLKEGNMNPIEVNMGMRMLQQQLLGRRMQKMQQQMQEQKQVEKSKNQEEEVPMRQMADQDL